MTDFKLIRKIIDIWITGLLVIFTGVGYLFYFILFLVRLMQVKKLLTFFSVLLIVVSIIFIYFFVPLKSEGGKIPVVIEKGTSIRAVAQKLEASEVIPSSKIFLLYTRFSGDARKMQAGMINFIKYEGIFKAAKKLSEAKPIEKKVTIPEGYNIWQMAAKLAEEFPFDSSSFITLCNDKNIIDDLNIKHSSLEGYLLPNTYHFSPKATAKEVIYRMVQELREQYARLEVSETAKKMSVHEVLTLASIVEKEAQVKREQPHIAGVFHNRLVKGWPLGADPTVRYSIRKFNGPLRVSEINNKSPYNTRVHKGLPPGPICSPGIGAIEATLNPMETEDLFFVAKWDGSGEHDFSKTNYEHVRKKLKIREMNENRKKEQAGKNG